MKKKDYYYYLAKKEKYPARSVYKLAEIDKKYQLINQGSQVLDLGCSPGSWAKYCSRKAGARGLIVAVDRKVPREQLGENVIYLQQDVSRLEADVIRQISSQFDVILSDLAPDTTGMKFVDQARSLELFRKALFFTGGFLKKGGYFLGKIFQGPEIKKLADEMRKVFKEVKIIKPKGSRKESLEIFLLGYNYQPAVNSAKIAAAN